MRNGARLILGLLLAALLVACAPRLQPELPHRVAPALYPDRAIMADGYLLPVSTWLPRSRPRAVVLVLHGFNDHRQGFAEAGGALARRGIAVYAYDQRGFGQTDLRGIWPGAEQLVEDAHTLSVLLRLRYPGVPLYQLGESMGSAVLLASLTRGAPPSDGLILVAPAVWARSTMPLVQRAGLWFGAHVMPGKTVTSRGLNITPSDNTTMLRSLARDPLIIRETRFDALYGLVNLMDEALRSAPRLNRAALILYGERDQIIPKTPVCRMFESLPQGSARQWRAAVYRNGYHMLTRDLQAQLVLSDIAAWIVNRRAPLPSGSDIDEAAAAAFCRQASPGDR